MIKTKSFFGKVFAFICACALAFGMMMGTAASAFAVGNYDGTTYRVTVYSGNHGTINGEDSIVKSGIQSGTTGYLNGLSVVLDPSDGGKYYAKGLRLAGYDNVRASEASGSGATQYYAIANADGVLVPTGVGQEPITEDMDFVVAYGIAADRVSYTVTYTDTEGNQLAEPQTFSGDIGEQAAVAAAYIEGYVPDATAIDMTLSSDESKNVFNFVYTRLAEGFTQVVNPDGTVSIVAPNGSVVEGAYTTNLNAPAAVPGGEELVTDDGTVVIGDDDVPLAAPSEVTLDDDGNPLAAGANEAQTLPWWPFAVGAALLGILIVFIVLKAKKKSSTSTDHA